MGGGSSFEKDEELAVTLRVCTHLSRKGKGCALYGSYEVLETLKQWLALQPEIESFVCLRACSCLGVCPKGVAAAISPRRKMLKKVTFRNLHRVKKAILKRVQRLKKKKSSEKGLSVPPNPSPVFDVLM